MKTGLKKYQGDDAGELRPTSIRIEKELYKRTRKRCETIEDEQHIRFTITDAIQLSLRQWLEREGEPVPAQADAIVVPREISWAVEQLIQMWHSQKQDVSDKNYSEIILSILDMRRRKT